MFGRRKRNYTKPDNCAPVCGAAKRERENIINYACANSIQTQKDFLTVGKMFDKMCEIALLERDFVSIMSYIEFYKSFGCMKNHAENVIRCIEMLFKMNPEGILPCEMPVYAVDTDNMAVFLRENPYLLAVYREAKNVLQKINSVNNSDTVYVDMHVNGESEPFWATAEVKTELGRVAEDFGVDFCIMSKNKGFDLDNVLYKRLLEMRVPYFSPCKSYVDFEDLGRLFCKYGMLFNCDCEKELRNLCKDMVDFYDKDKLLETADEYCKAMRLISGNVCNAYKNLLLDRFAFNAYTALRVIENMSRASSGALYLIPMMNRESIDKVKSDFADDAKYFGLRMQTSISDHYMMSILLKRIVFFRRFESLENDCGQCAARFYNDSRTCDNCPCFGRFKDKCEKILTDFTYYKDDKYKEFDFENNSIHSIRQYGKNDKYYKRICNAYANYNKYWYPDNYKTLVGEYDEIKRCALKACNLVVFTSFILLCILFSDEKEPVYKTAVRAVVDAENAIDAGKLNINREELDEFVNADRALFLLDPKAYEEIYNSCKNEN